MTICPQPTCSIATRETGGAYWCSRAVGHEGPCAAHEANIAITLNEYQRTNLIELLRACGYPYEPGGAVLSYNTGDWLGELYWKLQPDRPRQLPPNLSVEDMRARW